MPCCNTLAVHKKYVCICHIYDLDDFDELSVDNKDILIKRAQKSAHISWHRMFIRGKIMNRYTKIVQGYLTEAKPMCSSIIFIILKLRLRMLSYLYLYQQVV